ncbi:hypothetical protein Cni_G22386 [Canna indica]|uniref:Reverse transcriptase domain-containing protein n=1 Tax=Canna indica TaxID=4628 RepID=A0AAQ3KWM7_9LILI|nr:hypothetical protein Cni_G22386 [Canna indica]
MDENDKNTKYFHCLAKYKRSGNKIININLDEILVTDPLEIVNAFAKWYKDLWKEDIVEIIYSDWEFAKTLKWKMISKSKSESLCKEFSADEIWCAVNNLGRGKSPSPDGYNVKFFVKNWHILKNSIELAPKEFHDTIKIPNMWGKTNVIFVPKKEAPNEIIDYLPIASCTITYKILSKVIVNRLKPYIRSLISKEQSAFIQGRRMHDNILIASEIINVIHKSKRKYSYILIKLDLEKVFDRVSWKAMKKILEFMNFPMKMVPWIMACLSSTKFRCCANGVKSDCFQSFKGVRQGNPLPPYLFILMQDLLSKILNEYVGNGEIKGSSYKGLKLNHLLFEDDILLVVKGNKDNYKKVQNALRLYCKLTDQKVNIKKSKVYFPKACKENIKKEIIWEKEDDKEANLDTDNIESETKENYCHVIHCDAAWVNKEAMAGFGYTIKNKLGTTTVKESNSRKVHSPLDAEMWAIWYAIIKARELNLSEIRLLTNSMQATKILNRKDKPPWYLNNLVSDI